MLRFADGAAETRPPRRRQRVRAPRVSVCLRSLFSCVGSVFRQSVNRERIAGAWSLEITKTRNHQRAAETLRNHQNPDRRCRRARGARWRCPSRRDRPRAGGGTVERRTDNLQMAERFSRLIIPPPPRPRRQHRHVTVDAGASN